MTQTQLSQLPFCNLVKAYRKRARLTQRQLAAALGVHYNTVWAWEQGEHLPDTRGLVLELAKHLGLNERDTRQLLEASLIAVGSYWSVPFPRNPCFTGREEVLEQLHTLLNRNRAAALTQSLALSGLGGVGKTQTAIEYAYRYAQHYSALFWITAETSESLLGGFTTIAALLQGAVSQEADQSQMVAQVLRWLGSHRDWLLIVDNVEDLELVQRYLPTAPHGALLVTTRLQALGALAQPLELDPMPPEEGGTLLLRRARRLPPGTALDPAVHEDFPLATTLAEALGGLPLALDQAGAYMEETQCSLEDYLQLYQTAPLALLDERDRRSAHSASVVRTFRLALEQLQQRHPVAVDLVRWCAFFAPEAIPEELLKRSAALLGPAFEALARQSLHWQHALKEVLALSLLQRDSRSHTLSMHRLVQSVLKGLLDEPTRRLWAIRTVVALEASFPEEGKVHLWPQCQQYLPHVLVGARLIEHYQLALPEASRLLLRAGSYASSRAQYAQAHALLQQALILAEHLHAAPHPDIAIILDRLAQVYQDQGDLEQAEASYRRALALYEQTLGPTHFTTAITVQNLGVLYRHQGKHLEAEATLHRALCLYEQTVGSGHIEVAIALDNLALLSKDQGNFIQAAQYCQRALSIFEQLGAPALPEMATTLHNLAQLYRLQCAYEQAEPLYRRALTIYEQVKGAEHPHTATTLYRLAQLYQAQRRQEQAAALYQRALTIRETVLGSDHPQTAAVRADYQAFLEQAEARQPSSAK